jgi:CheY-like chemotaxis protein
VGLQPRALIGTNNENEMDAILRFIQAHKPYFDAASAVSSVVNLLGWGIGFVLLWNAWRRQGIRSVTLGPLNFQMQQDAVEATAAAARDWQARVSTKEVDVAKIRSTVARAFDPETADRLVGKAILWVDDNPANNELAVRALRKLQVDVGQVTTTEAGLAALRNRHFDLIISDMGRGSNMTAGYELLEAVRKHNDHIPFLIFAGSDKPEYRREAQQRGAQLSTNDMIELIDKVVAELGERQK